MLEAVPPADPITHEPGVVASSVYAHGRRLADIHLDDAGKWSRRDGHVVWIGLFDPGAELLARVQKQFDLHDLAIEDAAQPHQRPKLEQYGDGIFIVARTAQMLDGRIAFGETHLFVGKGYVVSVRHGPSTSYAPVRQRAESCPTVLQHGEDYILYALLDFIVDNYLPVLETVNAEVEAMEDAVIKGSLEQDQVKRLYELRRDLLRLRNAASALTDVCRRIQRVEVRKIDPSMTELFRDVSDNIHRVQEETDTLREVLAFAFEASMMAGQVQQTHISRRLAAWAAILAVPTAVAGIYGMNFEVMPELHWQYGYVVVLAAVAGICLTLYYRLRKSGWL